MNTRIETVNSKKQGHYNQIETQSNSNGNTTKQILVQEKKINVETIKRMMSEKKTTLLPLRN